MHLQHWSTSRGLGTADLLRCMAVFWQALWGRQSRTAEGFLSTLRAMMSGQARRCSAPERSGLLTGGKLSLRPFSLLAFRALNTRSLTLPRLLICSLEMLPP